jgi:hypothetical protein
MTVVRQQVKRKEMEYTLNEYCGMYLMLGACDNWANVVAREGVFNSHSIYQWTRDNTE